MFPLELLYSVLTLTEYNNCRAGVGEWVVVNGLAEGAAANSVRLSISAEVGDLQALDDGNGGPAPA